MCHWRNNRVNLQIVVYCLNVVTAACINVLVLFSVALPDAPALALGLVLDFCQTVLTLLTSAGVCVQYAQVRLRTADPFDGWGVEEGGAHAAARAAVAAAAAAALLLRLAAGSYPLVYPRLVQRDMEIR